MSLQTTQLKPPTQGPPLSGVGASAIVQQSEGAADAAFKAYFENRPAPSQATVRQVAAMSEGPNSEGETLVKLIFCEIYQSYGSQFRVGPETNDGSRKVTLVAEDIEEGRGGAPGGYPDGFNTIYDYFGIGEEGL